MKELNEVLSETDEATEQLENMARQIVSSYSAEVDSIIQHVSDHVNELNNDSLRALVSDLSFKAYSLSEAKEYSTLKSQISETLMKEQQAIQFNTSEGTVDVRKNISLLNTQNEQLVRMLYDTVSGLLKVKLDEVHRIVDTLKTVILSRNTEARINADINDTKVGI